MDDITDSFNVVNIGMDELVEPNKGEMEMILFKF